MGSSFIALVCNFRIQSQIMLLSCVKPISGFSLHSEYNLNIFPQTLASCIKWLLLPPSFIFCYIPSCLFFWFLGYNKFFPTSRLFLLGWSSLLPALYLADSSLRSQLKYCLRNALIDHPPWASLPHHHTVILCHCANDFLHCTWNNLSLYIYCLFMCCYRFTCLLIVIHKNRNLP